MPSFRSPVIVSARIGDAGRARAGALLDVARELLLGDWFGFTSRGSAELQGLDKPVPLYEVT